MATAVDTTISFLLRCQLKQAADCTLFAQEGSLLDEVARRQNAQNALSSREVLHIFLQVECSPISAIHVYLGFDPMLYNIHVPHFLSYKFTAFALTLGCTVPVVMLNVCAHIGIADKFQEVGQILRLACQLVFTCHACHINRKI